MTKMLSKMKAELIHKMKNTVEKKLLCM
jgi:hypothetical protein